MPQVWLTYEELGELMKCEPGEARRAVIEQEWSRRKSSDGFTRVKLSPALAHQYMLSYVATFNGDLSTDDIVDRLRGLLQRMGGSVNDLPRISGRG
jgi:hypothetical protein